MSKVPVLGTIFEKIDRSFERKLLTFTLLAVFSTAAIVFAYLIFNFVSITDFSLERNKEGAQANAEEFLSQYSAEKANSTFLQIKAAQDNLNIVGQAAQKMVDNRGKTAGALDVPLFQTEVREVKGALASTPEGAFDLLAPPAIAKDPRTLELLQESALLNLSMDAALTSNENMTFIYYVGDKQNPVTRAYPNIGLVDVLGEGVNALFWKDFFAENPAGWERYFKNEALQKERTTRITVESPYADAAGQGLVLTMFYPLWDKPTNTFAGAVGADISLDNIINNVLSFRVAETGFAFLMTDKGEVISMPQVGLDLFSVDLKSLSKGGLEYYQGALTESRDPAVKQLAEDILKEESGVRTVELQGGERGRELIAFASLPALNTTTYEESKWRIVVAVPEDEVFATLTATDRAVNDERQRISLIALGITAGLLALATVASARFARTATADVRTLAGAAAEVSARHYDLKLDLKSHDEIGQLGRAFGQMAQEIRDYTDNLELKVAERTAELQAANDQILELNEKLKDENVRLGAELDVAQKIQEMVLPKAVDISEIEQMEVATYMQPADEVGGDYYDVLPLGDGRIILGIGDVTGHGLPAGIIMLMAQTAVMALTQKGDAELADVVTTLNRVLFRNIVRIHEDKSMTLALVEVGEDSVSIAGQHESVLVLRANGELEVVDTIDLGLPVGLEEEVGEFTAISRVKMAPGDMLVLYTDGVTEAEDPAGTFFGLERLCESVQRRGSTGPVAEIMEGILKDLYDFIGDAHIHDDISVVVARRR